MAQPQVLTMSPESYPEVQPKLQRWLHKNFRPERNSIALMFAWALRAHFGERNENEDTIEFFDEADEVREGKAVIKIWDMDSQNNT